MKNSFEQRQLFSENDLDSLLLKYSNNDELLANLEKFEAAQILDAVARLKQTIENKARSLPTEKGPDPIRTGLENKVERLDAIANNVEKYFPQTV